MYMILVLVSIPVIMLIIVIRLFADELKSTQKEDVEYHKHRRPTISDIAEWRYGRDVREYKDISEYYALKLKIKFP